MKEKKNNKTKTVLLVLISLFIISYLLANFIGSFSEEKIQDQIVVVQIIGPITSGESQDFLSSGVASSSRIVKDLEKADENDAVKGIILEINSPGGTVVASEEIANKVKSIDKPVVSWIREIGTSGAYWVASSSDAIISDPLSITGSIGVIGSYLEFSELFEKYGVEYQQLTTGKYKDTGSPFKELTDDERRVLQGKIDKIHEYFVNEVASNRGLEKENVKELATGIFYLGNEAYDLGLVDYLGGKDLAINITKELAGIEDANIVVYEPEISLLDILSRLTSMPAFYIGKGIGSELYKSVEYNGFNINA